MTGAEGLALVTAALVLDALVGDPDRIWRRWPHPVTWFGWVIATADRRFNRDTAAARTRRLAGVAVILGLLALAAAAGWAAERLLGALPFGILPLAAVASVFLAYRSLRDHVGAVARAFASGGLPAGRIAVSMIVGRDPERLDEAGVCRAAIESAAENFSDGVVAPAFWLAVGGLPGLIAYKALNTADSMIGHLSVRHRDFGWAAARLDDVANLAPARLSGLLVALAAPAGGGGTSRALFCMCRDARLHRSPNAGWPESAMAGALGLALGGPRVYAAGPVDDPFLNVVGRRDASPSDIERSLRVLSRAALLHALGYAALALVIWSVRS